MTRIITLLLLAVVSAATYAASPLIGLMERLSPGLSDKIDICITSSDSIDRFALDQVDGRPCISANSPLSAAVGLFHYLSHYCSARPGWMQPRIDLPKQLPPVTQRIERQCRANLRYYLNYCTYSYSMPFWSWERWQQEIDWMALHGINMPLAIEGTATVWRNTLRRLGYPESYIGRFIAGPAYQAWWLMNNLEGWGGPLPDEYFTRQAALQQKILHSMSEWGMHPVLPGYSGMIPHDADSVLSIPIADGGSWLGFTRPAMIVPTSPYFSRVADIYYHEQAQLYGTAKYYSMDPFHEGGSTEGLDLQSCGLAIYQAMTQHAPGSKWLLQGWQENPRAALLQSLPADGAILLDLQAENEPMWQPRADIFSRHPWIYCMLLNFGGNEGLYGKTSALVEGYAKASTESATLCGVGLTMEAIGNNPVMYDLLSELPWMPARFDADSLLTEYVRSSYGSAPQSAIDAWRKLMSSVYASPADSPQQGTTESLLCARPADLPHQASAWANVKDYYDPYQVITAAELLLTDAQSLQHRTSYRYDAVNTVRQAVAECGRLQLRRIERARQGGDTTQYRRLADGYLHLIRLQDSITAMHPAMRLSSWLNDARTAAPAQADSAMWTENALRLITTWGPRIASDQGRLRDYSHREWSGLLGSLYLDRWSRWFEARMADLTGPAPQIDFFAIESDWINNPELTSPDTTFSAARLRSLLHSAISVIE